MASGSNRPAAAGFTRRTVLQAGAGVLAAPAIWGTARAANGGKIRMMTWAGYKFDPVKAAFESATGMQLVITTFPDQDAMLAQMKAGSGEGFDVCEPTADRVKLWQSEGFLQPIDEAKANIGNLNPAFLSGVAADTAKVNGQRYATPTVWGTEALCFDSKQAPEQYGTASYGDLWKPEFQSKVTVRAHSCLVGAGLYLQDQGKLPHPMREAFADPAKMTANYDIILKFVVAHKGNIAQFWTDENSAQGAFRANGCVIGQNWDTSAAALMKDGLPIGYLAPKEGALAWLQNFVIPKKGNADAAYAWLTWFNTDKASAMWADAYAANPVAKGADQHVAEFNRKFLAMAYPGDALQKLWWWPAQEGWFTSKRNEYVDKLQSA